jgi:hypothetical protein
MQMRITGRTSDTTEAAQAEERRDEHRDWRQAQERREDERREQERRVPEPLGWNVVISIAASSSAASP